MGNLFAKGFIFAFGIIGGTIIVVSLLHHPTPTNVQGTEPTHITIPSSIPRSIPTLQPTNIPTEIPSPTATVIPTKIVYPTATPTVYIALPVQQIIQPTTAAAPQQQTGGFTCNCSKTCPNMSCAEAQFQLNSCGCKERDQDKDGVACDAQCQ